MLHQIKAQHFYTDFGLYQQCKVLQNIVEFKVFSRFLSDFPVLFKADLIFKYFSRKPSKFKYFLSLCGPCLIFGSACKLNPDLFIDMSSQSFLPIMNVCLC